MKLPILQEHVGKATHLHYSIGDFIVAVVVAVVTRVIFSPLQATSQKNYVFGVVVLSPIWGYASLFIGSFLIPLFLFRVLYDALPAGIFVNVMPPDKFPKVHHRLPSRRRRPSI